VSAVRRVGVEGATSARSLRVLFVNSGLRFGGTETQLVAIIREMKRREHEPGVFLLTPDAPRAAEITALDVPLIVDRKRSRLDLGLLARLRRHIRTWRPDVVHGFLFDGNLYARLAAVGCGVPVLNSERSHDYRLNRSQWLIHRATRWMADGVVANTHAGRAFAAELFKLPEQHTHTVWNGVDLAAFDRRVARSARAYRQEWFGDPAVKLAVLMGTISPAKDYPLAMDVAEQLIERDGCWRVVCVGESYGRKLGYRNDAAEASIRLADEVQRRHAASRHASKILFVGQRSDAIEIIADANVLFSTSTHEGFPNAVLEAMACGVPVVSTAYSDIHRILDAQWVVASRDPGSLADAILEADRQRASLGPQVRAWVERHATIEHCVDTLEAVYAGYVASAAS
jgi:glycosyltransferase involved in cell wall biosynthesis